MKARWFLVLACVAGFGCGPLGKTQLKPVRGVITDRSGEPLKGVVATVVRMDQKGDPTAPICEVVSNAKGEFLCDALRTPDWEPVRFRPHREYVIEFTYRGFKSPTIPFTYTSETKPIPVKLEDGPDGIIVEKIGGEPYEDAGPNERPSNTER